MRRAIFDRPDTSRPVPRTRVAGQLASHANNLDGKGDRWYQAWTQVKPWEVSAETGYSIGASGVGTALLHVHLAEQGSYSVILLPDNPLPATRTHLG